MSNIKGREGNIYKVVIAGHPQFKLNTLVKCIDDDESTNPWFKQVSKHQRPAEHWWSAKCFAMTIEGNLELVKEK